MVSLDRELKVALRTGSIVLGSREVLKLISVGKGKLVIVASNCPELIKEQIEYYAKLSGIPIYHAPYTNMEIGEMCQRKHSISSLLVLEEGESEILKLVEQ
ncbi:MAG: 50S ribosomal protein L30e [Candidatus Verstraetearchaeota archaeon]|jgi:large subunit ribosomal protein L30e|nr:50S ribosomal protein L30e [Candidatus Verstraetearchaeota archaeon]